MWMRQSRKNALKKDRKSRVNKKSGGLLMEFHSLSRRMKHWRFLELRVLENLVFSIV